MPVVHALPGRPPTPPPRSLRLQALRRRDRRRARAKALLVLVPALVLALTTTSVVLHLRDRELVATIGNERIDRDEFLFQLARTQTPASTPAGTDATAHDALAQIAHDDAVLQLARRHHLTDIADFADLQEARSQENRRRAAAVASGAVVYGLTSFDLPTYYARTLQELTTQLQRVLSQDPADPLWVSDAQVTAAYDADPEQWQADVATNDYTELRVPHDVAAAPACSEVLTVTSDLEALTRNGTPCPGAVLTTGSLPPTTGREGPAGSVLDTVRGLDVGQVGPLQDDGSGAVLLRLDATHADRSEALAAYAPRIRQSLLEQGFDTYVSARAATPTIHLSHDRLTALTREGIDQ